MAYAAVSQIGPDLPPRILGTGETYGEAKAAAESWLEDQRKFVRQEGRDMTELNALAGDVQVLSEEELKQRFDLDLNEWRQLSDTPASH